MPRPLAAALALLAVLLAPAAALAGYLLVDEEGEQTLVSRGRLKMVPRTPDDPTMMFDLGRGRLWLADPVRRAYWEGTVEEYCGGLRGMMGGLARELDTQLADLPPEAREQMRRTLEAMQGRPPAGPPPRVTIERTGETPTIAGLPTRKYRVLADGRVHEEVWLTTDPGLLRELDPQRAPETYARMLACLAPAGTGGGVEETAEYRALYAHGWPVKSVYYGASGAAGRSTLVRVERREVPEADFAPPAGYRRAPLAEVLGTGR